MEKIEKPLLKAVLFVRNACCYAYVDEDIASDHLGSKDWASEPIRSTAPHPDPEWFAAALESCLLAFRRLQRKHPDKDIVISVDDPPVGISPFLPRRNGKGLTNGVTRPQSGRSGSRSGGLRGSDPPG